MTFTEEQASKLQRAEEVLGYSFSNKQLILSAITHPSATEGRAVKYSYERLEFLGDSILGAIVADVAFERFHELDEGGLTRIKVALVSGASLSDVASGLGFADIIVFGSSETGTGKRGLHSALENVYEAVVAALYLDGGVEAARDFIYRTLIPRMTAPSWPRCSQAIRALRAERAVRRRKRKARRRNPRCRVSASFSVWAWTSRPAPRRPPRPSRPRPTRLRPVPRRRRARSMSASCIRA